MATHNEGSSSEGSTPPKIQAAAMAPGADAGIFWNSLEVLENEHWLASSFDGRGDLRFAGNMRFTGRWQGTLSGSSPDSHLVVRQGAVIKGRIEVAKLSVEGTLDEVDVQVEWLHALPGCRISGRIHAKKLMIDAGALIEGRVVSSGETSK